MHQAIEDFLERPTSHKAAFWVGSILVICVLFWQYVYSASSTELDELTTKAEDLEVKIADERRRAANLEKLKLKVKDLDIKLKIALQELPDKKEIPGLLTSISSLARDAGLEIPLFKPFPEAYKDFYAEVPVAIAVTGTFHQVASFFDEVGHLPRIVNINQIVVREPKVGQDQVMVTADCVATTFRYLEENERAQQSKKEIDADAGKRRK